MTREEAINEIKSWDFLEGKEIEAIHTLIPELKESEDERIRKLLVWQVYRNIEDETNDLAQSVYDGIKGHDPDIEESIEDWKKCLAYLEKQKEQPISAEEVLARAGLKPYKDGNQWCILAGDNIQEGICGFGDTIDEALYQFLLEVLEKQKEQKNTSASTMAPSCWEVEQKEQKPVEPSDDELQRYQDELYDFKVFATKQAKEHHISFVHDFEWNNFCAGLLSYFNEQKPAECIEDSVKFEEGFKAGRERRDSMSLSSHAFTCGMVTTTGAIMNFIFNNPKGGWMLVGVSVIIFIIATVCYIKEKKEDKK